MRAIYDQDFRTVSDVERSYAITIEDVQVGGYDHAPSHTSKHTSVELQASALDYYEKDDIET